MAATPSLQRNETKREIENFMRALSSYPERFAINPCVSFAQHLSSVDGAERSVMSESRHS